jgi:hypothetical protein
MRIRRIRRPCLLSKRFPLFSILALTAGLGCLPATEPAGTSGEPTVQPAAVHALTSSATETSETPGEPTSPRVADIARDYKRLQSMTKEPVYVDPGLAMLCRGVTQREVEEARKKSGPHAHTAVLIYMDELAADAFRRKSTAYPVGSVIVKEKTGLGYDSEAQERVKAHDGIGGMINRPPGFDPAHGDWEYFYFEDSSKVESGKISSCVECHGGASTRDHVFGGWAKPG